MEDFDFFVSTAHMNSSGWDIDEFNNSNPFNTHNFYIRDFRYNHLRIFTIPIDYFDSLKIDVTPDDVAGDLGELVKRYSTNKSDQSDREMAAPILTSYAKGTLTYKAWKDNSQSHQRLHFMINIYRGKGGEVNVRPFASRSTETVVSVEEFMDISAEVKRMDKKNHPEWFR